MIFLCKDSRRASSVFVLCAVRVHLVVLGIDWQVFVDVPILRFSPSLVLVGGLLMCELDLLEHTSFGARVGNQSGHFHRFQWLLSCAVSLQLQELRVVPLLELHLEVRLFRLFHPREPDFPRAIAEYAFASVPGTCSSVTPRAEAAESRPMSEALANSISSSVQPSFTRAAASVLPSLRTTIFCAGSSGPPTQFSFHGACFHEQPGHVRCPPFSLKTHSVQGHWGLGWRHLRRRWRRKSYSSTPSIILSANCPNRASNMPELGYSSTTNHNPRNSSSFLSQMLNIAAPRQRNLVSL
jgi:hypothetical protein